MPRGRRKGLGEDRSRVLLDRVRHGLRNGDCDISMRLVHDCGKNKQQLEE